MITINTDPKKIIRKKGYQGFGIRVETETITVLIGELNLTYNEETFQHDYSLTPNNVEGYRQYNKQIKII